MCKSTATQLLEAKVDDTLAQLATMQDELDSLLAHGRMVIDGLNNPDPMIGLSRPEARPYPYE